MHSIDLLMSIHYVAKAYGAMLKKISTKFGLNPLEVKVIGFLHNNPKMNTAGDIAEYRMLSKGNVSQAVDSLINYGYLARMQDRSDRRRIRLSLLPAAQPVTDMLDAEWQKFGARLFSDFTESEAELYDSLRQKLMINARNIMTTCTAEDDDNE